jgi:hypothetical protein
MNNQEAANEKTQIILAVLSIDLPDEQYFDF